jgi:UDP-glucose 4-epimerase
MCVDRALALGAEAPGEGVDWAEARADVKLPRMGLLAPRPRTVVFGGGGFIGSHIAEELLEHGYPVKVFARPGAASLLPASLSSSVPLVSGDFMNEADVSRALEECELAIHAVSSTIPANSNQAPTFDAETNLLPTLRFLDEARRRGVKRVLFLSSGGTVYGRAARLPIGEDAPTFPLCSYGIVKLALEKYLHMYADLYGLRHTIVRLANPYGERQSPSRRQGAIAVFLDRLAREQPLEVFGDGSIVRDYVYIRDASRAIRLLIEADESDGVFNIGTGVGTSLADLIEHIRATTGRTVEVKKLPGRKVDVPANVLSFHKLERLTGWKPSCGLAEGIGRTWEWHRRHAAARGD